MLPSVRDHSSKSFLEIFLVPVGIVRELDLCTLMPRSREDTISFIGRIVLGLLETLPSMRVSISSERDEVLVGAEPLGRVTFIEAKEVTKHTPVLPLGSVDLLDLRSVAMRAIGQLGAERKEGSRIDKEVSDDSSVVLEVTAQRVTNLRRDVSVESRETPKVTRLGKMVPVSVRLERREKVKVVIRRSSIGRKEALREN